MRLYKERLLSLIIWQSWDNRNDVRNGEDIVHQYQIKTYIQVITLCNDVPNFFNRCEPNALPNYGFHYWGILS